ncbi:MAG: hypothetical protein IMZ43_06445 [Thermoplasmata archaeon]|nr:hypothetical protein [Thermoplasmata archaeon]
MNMESETAKLFLNKPVELTFNNNFVLHGKITAVDSNGFVFVTTQRTSYISFSLIATILLEENETKI